jgi:hypothetical protein
LQIDFYCDSVLAMDNLRFIILDEFDGKPFRAFSNKASALWFLENRPNCKLHILPRPPKAKVVPMSELYEECLF